MRIHAFKTIHDVVEMVTKCNNQGKHYICPNCGICSTCDNPHECANTRAILKAAA